MSVLVCVGARQDEQLKKNERRVMRMAALPATGDYGGNLRLHL